MQAAGMGWDHITSRLCDHIYLSCHRALEEDKQESWMSESLDILGLGSAFGCIVVWMSFVAVATKKHSWKNAQTAQTLLCYFSALLCYFLPVDTQVLVNCFAFCCENWHKRWMNRHPVSLRGGQTCVLMVIHTILRHISNSCFCAVHSRELSVCAILFTFFRCASIS